MTPSNLFLRKLLLVALSLCALSFVATAAQDARGTISGLVSDQKGRTLSNVKVVITHLATETTRSTLTTGKGMYSVPYLPPGLYSVGVEVKGKVKPIQNHVRVRVADKLQVDIKILSNERLAPKSR